VRGTQPRIGKVATSAGMVAIVVLDSFDFVNYEMKSVLNSTRRANFLFTDFMSDGLDRRSRIEVTQWLDYRPTLSLNRQFR
jgi:hypothetical protein